MGAKLSATQKGVFYQVVGTLGGGNYKFNKREVKSLVRWLTHTYPDLNAESVLDPRFLKRVQSRLQREIQAGSKSFQSHFCLISLLISALAVKPSSRTQPADPQLYPSSPRPHAPALRSSRPPSRTESLRGAARDSPAPGRHPSLSSSRATRSPSLRRSGQPPEETVPAPSFRTPSTPVVKPKVRFSSPRSSRQDGVKSSQNGGDCVFNPKKPPSPSQSSPTPSRAPPQIPPLPPSRVPPTSPPLPPPPSPPPPPPPPAPETPPPPPPPSPPATPPPSPPLPPPPASAMTSWGPSHKGRHFAAEPSLQFPRRDPPSPAPGSHALPSGSHALGASGGGVPSWGPELSAVPSAAPVVFHPAGDGTTLAQWVPFSHSSMKELCKAQKEFGRDSEYFRGLLQAVLAESVITPADLRRVFRCLLNSTEQVLWEAAWRKEALKVLPSLWDSPNSRTSVDGEVISIDHMLGTGNWSDGAAQVRAIPVEVLQQTARAAEKAFLGLRAAAPQVPYAKVLQGAEEPFLEFVERLRKSINYQVEGEHLQAELLKEMAFLNANSACKDAINSLPLEPAPTLRDMLLVCGKKVLVPSGTGPPPAAASRLKTPFRPAAAAVEEPPFTTDVCPTTAQPLPPTSAPVPKPPATPCHLCGKLGHWMPACPLKQQFYEFKKSVQGTHGQTIQKN
ncbi:uncharacterized protein LOC129046810 [Molothrus ater]|uniref:uncharacterized protein LOC129046810 n=1 Tax=Molothrus ater TaxID=84834 RepID=UPI0023E88C95|nr:uncharacterized protein LOC129046810 [Molothrus ater]